MGRHRLRAINFWVIVLAIAVGWVLVMVLNWITPFGR